MKKWFKKLGSFFWLTLSPISTCTCGKGAEHLERGGQGKLKGSPAELVEPEASQKYNLSGDRKWDLCLSCEHRAWELSYGNNDHQAQERWSAPRRPLDYKSWLLPLSLEKRQDPEAPCSFPFPASLCKESKKNRESQVQKEWVRHKPVTTNIIGKIMKKINSSNTFFPLSFF